jgi:hypothetical protein
LISATMMQRVIHACVLRVLEEVDKAEH